MKYVLVLFFIENKTWYLIQIVSEGFEDNLNEMSSLIFCESFFNIVCLF